jgi:hypothetical protein
LSKKEQNRLSVVEHLSLNWNHAGTFPGGGNTAISCRTGNYAGSFTETAVQVQIVANTEK